MSAYLLPTLDGALYLNLDTKKVSIQNEGGSVVGARASVETAGQIEKKITATRVLLTGVFALAWQKTKDARELYILVHIGRRRELLDGGTRGSEQLNARPYIRLLHYHGGERWRPVIRASNA